MHLTTRLRSVNRILRPCYIAGVLAWGGLTAHADVTLPALISDHAVLQRSAKTAVWGTATPGESVRVALATAQAETVAGPDGKWKLALDLSQVGPGPFELTVKGNNTLTVKDVLVGEVWLAAGQSNMAFTLQKTIGAQEEIARAATPRLRQFTVPNKAEPTPQATCAGEWIVASPATAEKFSAVGYYFGKKISETLDTPVGLINAAVGGTPIESWTSLEALKSQPTMPESIEQIAKTIKNFDQSRVDYAAAQRAWEKKLNRENLPANTDLYSAPNIDTADWKKVKLPGKLRDAGLPDAGVVWLRRTVTIINKADCSIRLAGAEGFASVYINGKFIKEMKPENYQEAGGGFKVNPAHINIGENLIAIRLHNAKGNIGMMAGAHYFMLCEVKLLGDWLAKAETAFPALSKEEAASYPVAPLKPLRPAERPANLYNGMIHPLLATTIKGAIWYQGEHNSGRGFLYKTSFSAMIQDWRNQWGYEFPFYYCQLPNNGGKSNAPRGSNWAELRAAQAGALSLPKTGQAILLDVGEADDLHPRNKKVPGERLARLALAQTYGRDVVSESPRFEHYKVEGDKIRITFRSPTGGLVAQPVDKNYTVCSLDNAYKPLVRNSPNSELEGFAIWGADKKWVWADAKIDGDTVLVWSSAVPKPVAVRFAWADNPTVNLYNKAGLPAAPFRTDDEPWISAAARY